MLNHTTYSGQPELQTQSTVYIFHIPPVEGHSCCNSVLVGRLELEIRYRDTLTLDTAVPTFITITSTTCRLHTTVTQHPSILSLSRTKPDNVQIFMTVTAFNYLALYLIFLSISYPIII